MAVYLRVSILTSCISVGKPVFLRANNSNTDKQVSLFGDCTLGL